MKQRVAAVQSAPVFNDLPATVDKTIALIEEAGRKGVQLLNFPETWIPGYPWFIWLEAPAHWARYVPTYFANSLEIDSPAFRAICDAARAAKVFVGLGHSERRGGSLYMGQALIGDDGVPLFVRRKLKPTHVERAVFGEGDGSDFHVVDTALGRIGALCCWEHLQPLSKFAQFSAGEQIHLAAWPSLSLYSGMVHTMSAEATMAASMIYAIEGQCFVIAATQVVSKEILEILADTDEKAKFFGRDNRDSGAGGGCSMIFGPDGRRLAEPMPEDEEGLVIADIDMTDIAMAKGAADPAGHYSRPDVLRLRINRTANRVVETVEEPAYPAEVRAIEVLAEEIPSPG